MNHSGGSTRWTKNLNIGDCKTCLGRISPQKLNNGMESDTITIRSHQDIFKGTDLSDSQMSSQLLASLKSMREEEILCDVTLCTEHCTIKIPAHKVVLAAASPYFRKMFSYDFKEAQNGEVKFHDISFEVLRSVVNFIYTGKIKIDEHLVDGLLDAADILQLPSLRNLCLWWLNTNLTPSSCLGIFVLAQLRLHLDLAEAAKNYTIEHFREVLDGEEFLHLSPEHLQIFLDSPYIGCDNEGQLLKALLEWTNHQIERRTPNLISLIDRIELMAISPQVFIEAIQHPVIMSNPTLEKQLRTILTAILAKKFDSMEPKVSTDDSDLAIEYLTRSRNIRSFHEQDVIFALGGESQGQSLSNVECFMLGYDGWKCSIPPPISSSFHDSSCPSLDMEIVPTMKQCRYYPAIASDKYSLYVIGGQDCGFPVNIVEKYSSLTNRWTSLTPLPMAVHGCGAAMVNGRLFLAGGRSSQNPEKRIWCYDQKNDVWNESLSMTTHRAHLAVCSTTGELYAIGGIGGHSEAEGKYLSSVEKYDPFTQCWTTLAPMHEERAFHSAAVVDGHIYVMGGCNGKMWLRTVERFDIMNGQWSKVSNMSVPRSSFGITVSGGRIYCIGGYDGVHFLNTVEKYNPRTDRWHCVHAMQIERYGLVSAKLSIPLKSASSSSLKATTRNAS